MRVNGINIFGISFLNCFGLFVICKYFLNKNDCVFFFYVLVIVKYVYDID